MDLFNLVIEFDKKRDNELLLNKFLFSNVKDEQKAIEILNKYIDNDKPLTEQDMYELGIIPDTEIWDI
jgi:hypothetical protein